MMRMDMPSLGGLRAFDAVARHLSMTLAAGELRVTPGAVSLQIKELEAALGVQLFVRQSRRLILTPKGDEYFATVRTAFRMIREATAEIVTRSRLSVLTVSCTPSFAMQWLVPRLSRFESHVSDIDIRISASNRVMDFARDGIDVAIRHGFGGYDGLASDRILDDDLVPVCSPEFLRRSGAISSPGDLHDVALLHDEHRHDWRLWLQAAGDVSIDISQGTIFTDSNGAIDAAKAGLGVALVRRAFVERELAAGTLVAPLLLSVASDLAYYLVYPPAALSEPTVVSFREWLISEAAR
jgi:LysR family transcriptional regulator, glycine cleavage system transcriptional activator